MATLIRSFDRFLRERTYLENVSPKTLGFSYETAWKTFLRTQAPGFGTTPIGRAPGDHSLTCSSSCVALRDRGVRPVTVNTWLRALNAFCRWLHEEGTTLRRETVRSRSRRQRPGLVETLHEAALRGILSFPLLAAVSELRRHHRQGCRLCGAEVTG